jgi:hypothetical protein
MSDKDKEIQRLREALEVYAQKENWINSGTKLGLRWAFRLSGVKPWVIAQKALGESE